MGLLFYVPVSCTLIGFVLTVLGIFAGNTPGFMEEYSIIMLNTSALGRNYVPALNPVTKRDVADDKVLADEAANATAAQVVVTGTTGNQDDRNGGGDSSSSTNDTKVLEKRELTLSAAKGVLAGLPADTAADDMAEVLGVGEFYSLHILNICEGTFAPNATAVGSWRNVSECTTQLSASQLNMTSRIDGELNDNFIDGGSLARLGGSASLMLALNRIPTLGVVLATFYILTAVASGLSLLLVLASVVTRAMYARETVLANLAAASAATLTLLIAGLVTAVAVSSTVSSINRLGKDTIGMEAAQGRRFEKMTWAAFAMMLISSLYWVYELHGEAKRAAAAAAAAAAKKKAAAPPPPPAPAPAKK